MNAWRSSEADAHLAKAEAFENAVATLTDILPAVTAANQSAISQAVQVLNHEQQFHEKQAALVKAA